MCSVCSRRRAAPVVACGRTCDVGGIRCSRRYVEPGGSSYLRRMPSIECLTADRAASCRWRFVSALSTTEANSNAASDAMASRTAGAILSMCGVQGSMGIGPLPGTQMTPGASSITPNRMRAISFRDCGYRQVGRTTSRSIAMPMLVVNDRSSRPERTTRRLAFNGRRGLCATRARPIVRQSPWIPPWLGPTLASAGLTR